MCKTPDAVIQRIADALSVLPGIQAVVLGGSRATGAADDASDIDIGIYYDRSQFDRAAANAAAQALDDAHRPGLIGPEGSWGAWVNFGAWIAVNGWPTDLIFRDLDRVGSVIDETDVGIIHKDYHYGHPHAFLSMMYRGELAVCRTLWCGSSRFDALKQRAEGYPDPLKKALIGTFLDEARFTGPMIRKAAQRGDLCCLAGLLFRGISCLNQVLFAANERWCLNEKQAVRIVDGLPLSPSGYRRRVEGLFAGIGEISGEYDALLKETEALAEVR